MRKLILLLLLAITVTALTAVPGSAKPIRANGKIVLNSDNRSNGKEEIYTVDPDGTNRHLVGVGATGQWSPDGTRIALSLDCCGAGTMKVATGSFKALHLDSLYPDRFLGCGVWSADGARLACEGLSDGNPAVDGIYTVRSSDGGDLQRVTSNPGGDDCPSDYSPNGKRLVFSRLAESGSGIFTGKLDGTGLRQITPPGTSFDFCSGSWSPKGNLIVFSAHVPESERSTIWVAHADGSGLRKIPVPGCGGARSLPDGSPNSASIGCQQPTWSPNGKKIVFGRHLLSPNDHFDLYTVSADGSRLKQVTDTPDVDEYGGDWGTRPVTP
jgi:Tol biopolymer transport system component